MGLTQQYDLVVIGTGTAASVAASRCRSAGWRVAVVDHLPFGGTCALRGCDPKKVLVGVAEAIDHMRRLRGHGVAGPQPAIDWPAIDWRDLVAFKRSFTEPVPAATERRFAEAGIDAYHGRARFRGPTSVAVASVAVEDAVLEGRFILVAVGAVPMRLGIPGEAHAITSTEFLDLDELPPRIAMLGGGYIAAEFAHIAARAGASVTIIEQADRMLTPFDPDLVGWLMETFDAIGVDRRMNTRVVGIDRQAGAYAVHVSGHASESVITADLVVHAAGRRPDLDPLDLGAAGVAAKDGRIELNDFLQSVSNPAVYAAGDAAAKGPALTPVASHDATVAARNMIEGNRHQPNYLGVPSIAFTVPPIAAVGLGERQARDHGLPLRVNRARTSGWYTARRVRQGVYGHKILIEAGSERLLGAHLVGPDADAVINLFAMAIRHGLTAADLKSTIFGYPTGASDIGYML